MSNMSSYAHRLTRIARAFVRAEAFLNDQGCVTTGELSAYFAQTILASPSAESGPVDLEHITDLVHAEDARPQTAHANGRDMWLGAVALFAWVGRPLRRRQVREILREGIAEGVYMTVLMEGLIAEEGDDVFAYDEDEDRQIRWAPVVRAERRRQRIDALLNPL